MFPARFDSRCRSCGDPIEVGDEIGYIDGEEGVHCAACVDASEYDPFDDEEHG